MAKATLSIDGMHCAACVSSVERALGKVAGVASASVNLTTQAAVVEFDPQVADAGELTRAVERAGYKARVRLDASGESLAGPADAVARPGPGALSERDARHAAEIALDHERLTWRRRAVIASFLAAPVVVLGMFFMQPAPGPAWSLYTQLALTLGVFGVVGVPIVVRAARGVVRGRLDMDTLIAVGSTSALLAGVIALAAPWLKDHVGGELGLTLVRLRTHVYFDTAAVILALVALGRYLEIGARAKAGESVRQLMKLAPDMATVIDGKGREHEAPAADLRVGDLVLVRPGQRVSADGVCEAGSASAVDESMLTGESVPVPKKMGDSVTGGTLNTSGVLRVRVTASGAKTVLAQIARLVEDAQAKKSRVQRLADQAAGVFVPAVLMVALGTLLYWGVALGEWPSGVRACVSVLIVACPCALGLAVPMAVVVGSGIGARRGILLKDPSALERAARIDAVLLDKTGTITTGQLSVSDYVVSQWFDASDALQQVHGVTRLSDHPVSRAVTLRLRELNVRSRDAVGLHQHEGRGVTASVDGQEVYVGQPSAGLLEAAGDDVRRMMARGSSVAVAAIGKRYAASFALLDRIKPEARAVVTRLRDELKLRVIMVTGDHQAVAASVAGDAGIKDFKAGVRPEAKAAMVLALQAGERGEDKLRVAMVGDGINDAPALAASDLGIAMGHGSDIAKHAGHVVLTTGDLRLVPQAIVLARAMMQRVQLALAGAVVYNLVLIPVAAMDMLHPMLAGLAMVLSSLSVVGAALSLHRVKLD
jgi:Cu+-exporting ATPase